MQTTLKVTPVPGILLCLSVLRNEVQWTAAGDVLVLVLVLVLVVAVYIGLHWINFDCCYCYECRMFFGR